MVIEAGRALVLAFNKWDLVDEDRRYLLEREIDRELAQLAMAPRVNISAKSGRAVQKLAPALDDVAGVVDARISTGRLNTFLKEVVAATRRRCAEASNPNSVRHAGDCAAADVCVVHHRFSRSGLPAVP